MPTLALLIWRVPDKMALIVELGILIALATYALSFSDELGTDQLLTLNLSGSVVPEPSTVVLLLTGAAGLLIYAWRRRRR